jgi:small subunit ribosomal protein S20
MPNTTSAKKRLRQTIKRTETNRARMSRVRTFVRKVEEAIAAGDKQAAGEALRAAEPEIMRGANKGVIHKNTASRKVSRLAKRIKGMAAERA